MRFGFLIDTVLCIGCEACLDACHEIHQQPASKEPRLSATNFTMVHNRQVAGQDIYYRQMCMHCDFPSCASVCPVGAFEKSELGAVLYHPEKCMGCRYCMVACPFDVPKYEWSKALPVVKKCDMCYDRIRVGGNPACAEACPTGATLFGPRETLIQAATERIRAEQDKYQPYIYGLREAGGTSVLIISSVALDQLGFKINNYQQRFPHNTWQVMREIPNVVAFGGVFLYGLWWIINRRMTLEAIPVIKSDAGEVQ